MVWVVNLKRRLCDLTIILRLNIKIKKAFYGEGLYFFMYVLLLPHTSSAEAYQAKQT